VTRKPIGIHFIFQKNEKGHPTIKARLYQDILRYSINKDKREEYSKFDDDSFTHWRLAKWLMLNNQELINRYKDLSTRNTPVKIRIENTQQRTKDRLNDLISLNLITEIGTTKVSKGNATTPLYKFTYYGTLLARLIESFDPKRQVEVDNEIYNLLNAASKQYHTSLYIFGSALHKKYIDNGVFDDFVVGVLRRRTNSNIPIWNMNEFFDGLQFPVINDFEKAKLFVRLWRETFNEMHPEIQALLLHSIKLKIENKMEHEARYHEGFETVRFKIRDRYDVATIEGHCKNCNSDMNAAMPVLFYLERIQIPLDDPITQKCRSCKTESSIIYPKLEF